MNFYVGSVTFDFIMNMKERPSTSKVELSFVAKSSVRGNIKCSIWEPLTRQRFANDVRTGQAIRFVSQFSTTERSAPIWMSGLTLATEDYWRAWIWQLNQVQKGSEESKYLHRRRIGSIEMGNW